MPRFTRIKLRLSTLYLAVRLRARATTINA